MSFCSFSFGHCVVLCPSSIYGFWLSHWYLQTVLVTALKHRALDKTLCFIKQKLISFLMCYVFKKCCISKTCFCRYLLRSSLKIPRWQALQPKQKKLCQNPPPHIRVHSNEYQSSAAISSLMISLYFKWYKMDY